MWLENGLTVGDVAGLISGAISLLHIAIPLLWAFILVAVIRDRDFDAATWSSISHLLQSSWWPLLLQSDGAVGNFLGKVIRWRVFLLSNCVTFATICLIVANFLTPKPLAEAIVPANDATDVEFAHAPDTSYYGQAMLERQPQYRRCGWNAFIDCPNSIYDDPTIRKKYANSTVINSTIPQITLDTFRSGTKAGTIASAIDIESRAYIMTQDQWVDNNASRPVSRTGPLPMLLVEEKFHVVEGLIVDTINGGVGIRNHTVPVGLELGATWTEDILFISPETRCTSTNLSLHFSVTNNISVTYGGDLGFLQDDGGFSNIPAYVPSPRWDTNDSAWKQVGPVPDLKQSADIMAWWNNQLTARTMNLTTSVLGNQYRNQLVNYAHLSSTSAIKISTVDGGYLDDIAYNVRSDMISDFRAYWIRCTGYFDDDPSAVGKAFVQCGYLYDIPTPEHLISGQPWRSDPGSGWKQNLYTCASAVSASIKEVTFSINGTSSLENLNVLSVKPKEYTSDNMPTWGIEKVDSQKFQIWDVYKFWGLIDPALANASNVDAYRQPQIYLPAAVRGPTIATHMYDNFAAGGFFTAAWESVYAYAAAADSMVELGVPNYSGALDYGLTLKWRQLSQQGATGVEHILNLIWTDLVAFATSGSRTGFEGNQSGSSSPLKNSTALGVRKVYRYVRVIQYEDIRYAIPAFVAGAFFVFPLIICLLLLCFQRRSWRALNHYMNQTSMGRTATQLMLRGKNEEISPYASTRSWALFAQHLALDMPQVPVTKEEQRERMASRPSNQRPYFLVNGGEDTPEIVEARGVGGYGRRHRGYESVNYR